MTAIELELFRHLLASIAEEMGIVLRKTSYSANIKERRDFSCALFDPKGQMLAQGEYCPAQLGAYRNEQFRRSCKVEYLRPAVLPSQCRSEPCVIR